MPLLQQAIAFLDGQPFTALSNLIGVLGVLGAGIAAANTYTLLRQRRRLDTMLTIRLQAPGGRLDVPIRRRHLTRAEVQGRLRNFHRSGNFEIARLSTVAYLDDIEALYDASGPGVLEIPCSDKELAHFDLDGDPGG